MLKTVTFCISLAFLVNSCAPAQFVVPLDKGEHAVNASLGGPLANVPGIATIPIPFSSLGYGYGLTGKSVIQGTLYPTAALFGVFQVSGGYTHEFWKRDKMNVTGKIGFDFMTDVFEKQSRIWPQLDGNFSYTYQNKEIDGNNKRKLFYVGFSNWFELTQIKAHGEEQTDFIFFNPHIGHQMKKNNWAFHFELAFLATNLDNEKVVIDYKSAFGNRGATGIYLGVQYHLK